MVVTFYKLHQKGGQLFFTKREKAGIMVFNCVVSKTKVFRLKAYTELLAAKTYSFGGRFDDPTEFLLCRYKANSSFVATNLVKGLPRAIY